MNIKAELIAAMGHLNTAYQNSESREEKRAINDVMFNLNRRIKTTSQMEIAVPTSDTIRHFKAVREDEHSTE
jgi:hypothetical protein